MYQYNNVIFIRFCLYVFYFNVINTQDLFPARKVIETLKNYRLDQAFRMLGRGSDPSLRNQSEKSAGDVAADGEINGMILKRVTEVWKNGSNSCPEFL